MPRYEPYPSVAPSHSASSDPRSPRIPAISTTPSKNVTFGRSIRRSIHYSSYEDVAAFSPLSSPFTNVLTSPASASGTSTSGTLTDQLSSIRVNKAIDNASSAMSKAEAGIVEISAMRDQQARYINQQETILTMLELESDKMDNELQDLQREILQLDSDIAQLKKSPGSNNASNDASGESIGQSIRYKLRSVRSKT